MSHYSEYETGFKDSGCLQGALNDMGYLDVEIYGEAQPLFGFQGDFRLKTDWKKHTRDPELAVRANVIVRRREIGSSANDLGFIRKEDGTLSAIISEFDSTRHNPTWMGALKQRYAVHLNSKVAIRRGMRVKETKLPNGSIKLTCRG